MSAFAPWTCTPLGTHIAPACQISTQPANMGLSYRWLKFSIIVFKIQYCNADFSELGGGDLYQIRRDRTIVDALRAFLLDFSYVVVLRKQGDLKSNMVKNGDIISHSFTPFQNLDKSEQNVSQSFNFNLWYTFWCGVADLKIQHILGLLSGKGNFVSPNSQT